jgi:hypothetical protein
MDTRGPAAALSRKRLAIRIAASLALLAAIYVGAAYIVLPALWTHYEHEPGLASRPMVTTTADGIPGDPLNVGLVGSRAEILVALRRAGWYPADALTLKSDIEIAGAVLFDRPFRQAPVSPLFYEGRREDLAFEKPHGQSPDRRNHVRFWQTLAAGGKGRPVWLGSATFDRGVELSHYTGQVTHRISADVDAERDLLIADLAAARVLIETFQVTGAGPTLFGRNGGGDRYYTDGELTIGVLAEDAAPAATEPKRLPNPPIVELKNEMWDLLTP